MKTTVIAFFSVVGSAAAQAVTSQISPTGSPPPGCTGSYSGHFEVQVRIPSAKRDVPITPNDKRQNQCSGEGTLVAALRNGILTDLHRRTGYIASNYQLQFDAPPQAGAIYTAGFSICENDTLALGGSTQWWGCVSGSFYNIYDHNWALQCNRVEIDVLPCSGGDALSGSSSNEGEEQGDVEAIASPAAVSDAEPSARHHMCQISDGQVQHHESECPQPEQTAAPQDVSTEAPVSQSTDSQIEATQQASAQPQGEQEPISQSTGGQTEATQQASAAPQVASEEAPVSQSTDGQIEETQQATATPQGSSEQAPVSQSSEGQIEATQQATAAPQGVETAPLNQISDGQIQATSIATAKPQPVSQSSEGQIEATQQATAAPQGVETAPLNQISDGQIQATSIATAKPQSVSQSSEGQIGATSQATAQTQTVSESASATKFEEEQRPEESESESAPRESRTDEVRTSAAPETAAQESFVQTNSAASAFTVNWASRTVTASVTPGWLAGAGGGKGGAVVGRRLIGSAQERYQVGSAHLYALGILGMLFWIL